MICVTLAIVALGITLYPLISNFLADTNRSIVETKYEKAVEELDDSEIISAHMAAQSYNSMLLNVTTRQYTRAALQQASDSYEQLLNIRGDGIMGYLHIPVLNLELPIYHGTDEKTLDHGLGHLLGSSLPVGGTGTHCVITGHSGLAGQRIFSDLDKLQTGDIFYLKVLDETLAYMIMEINTVLPEDTSKLTIEPSNDNVTLITCTPYGINTHRLLLRGTRIPYEQAESIVEDAVVTSESPKSTWRQEYLRGLAYGVIGIVVVAAGVITFIRKKQHRRTSVPKRSDRYSMPSPLLQAQIQPRRGRNPVVPQRKRGKHEAP